MEWNAVFNIYSEMALKWKRKKNAEEWNVGLGLYMHSEIGLNWKERQKDNAVDCNGIFFHYTEMSLEWKMKNIPCLGMGWIPI